MDLKDNTELGYPRVGTKVPSSTGGTIEYTKTGLIHHSGTVYSGKLAAKEEKNKDDL
jgi:hypothetical protein